MLKCVTEFPSFLKINNIPWHVCVSHPLHRWKLHEVLLTVSWNRAYPLVLSWPWSLGEQPFSHRRASTYSKRPVDPQTLQAGLRTVPGLRSSKQLKKFGEITATVNSRGFEKLSYWYRMFSFSLDYVLSRKLVQVRERMFKVGPEFSNV